MAQATFVQDGASIDYTPGSDVAAGDVIVLGSLSVAIAKQAIASGVLGALATRGVFDGAKATGAIVVGDAIYWDEDGDPVGGVAGSGAFTTTASGNLYAGRAVAAAAEAAATVRFELRETDVLNAGLAGAIADPGDAGAIPVTRSGTCPLVTADAETRTLAIPTFAGQLLNLGFKTDGGDCVVTAASGVNQTGNNTLTFADAGDQILLVAIENGAALAWRVVSNDGVALSTV